MKIISRNEWGARKAKPGVSIVPDHERTEFIVHHSGGPADQTVRAIQDWCIDGRGFLDVDYNFLIRGTTGEIYTGRGWSVAGSHTKGHNTRGIGVCIIGTDQLTDPAKDAVRWLYQEACRRAGRSLKVYGHRDLDSTDCPGRGIYTWVRSGQIETDPPRDLKLTVPRMTGRDVRRLQEIVGVRVDGVFGLNTDHMVRQWQEDHGLDDDGIVGPLTRARMGLS